MTDEKEMQHIKKMIQRIEEFQSHDPWTVFSDFIGILAAEIRLPFSGLAGDGENVKEELASLCSKYSEKERAIFAEMGAELMTEMEEQVRAHRIRDVFSTSFHEMAMSNTLTGQFFTPENLCQMTARAVMDEERIRGEIQKKGYIVVTEPACGAGGMLVAAADALISYHLNPQKVMFVYAADIDRRCVNMCYIQLSLYGIPAIVDHRNTLTTEHWGTYFTPAYWLDLWNLRNPLKRGES